MWAIASHLAVAAYFDVAAGAKPTGATEPELLYIYFSVIVFFAGCVVLCQRILVRADRAAQQSHSA
jgi:hypothetical protein